MPLPFMFRQAVRINEHGGTSETVGPAVRKSTGLGHDPNKRHPHPPNPHKDTVRARHSFSPACLPPSGGIDSAAALPATTRRARRLPASDSAIRTVDSQSQEHDPDPAPPPPLCQSSNPRAETYAVQRRVEVEPRPDDRLRPTPSEHFYFI
jgi:hypothetical protein